MRECSTLDRTPFLCVVGIPQVALLHNSMGVYEGMSVSGSQLSTVHQVLSCAAGEVFHIQGVSVELHVCVDDTEERGCQ